MSVKVKDLVKNKKYFDIRERHLVITYSHKSSYKNKDYYYFNYVMRTYGGPTCYCMTLEEVEKNIYEYEKEAPEPDTYKPDHYYKNSFKVSDVQEEIGYNIFKALGSDDKAYKSSVWVTYALKHLCRAGNKDDVKLELKKAINYLTKALEGEFISE